MWLAMAGKASLSIRFGGVCLFILSPQLSAREYSYSQAMYQYRRTESHPELLSGKARGLQGQRRRRE
jgi:hypothetical protein